MRVLIVEDETTAQANLREMLHEYDSQIEIVGISEGVKQTINWLANNDRPDLIFMDIHLSDGSAFTIFDMINIQIPIIFTTAYDQYAIDAFRVNSIDYLLKPIKQERLREALDKFKRLTDKDISHYIQQMGTLRPKQTYKERLLIPIKDKLVPINLSQVSCFYVAEKLTYIYMQDGTLYTYAKSLEQIATMIDPNNFIRANKQYIISRNSVRDITIWFDNRLRITLDVATPEYIFISKNKASEFKAWFTNENI
jgi:DNA-binding LytR/AlgR family response regulator